MRSLARTYRIATSLSIAVARLQALIPLDAQTADGGRLHFAAEAQFDEANQSARITLHLRSFMLVLGRWHVVGIFEHEHSRIIARYANFIVTIAAPFLAVADRLPSAAVKVARDGADCTPAQARRAMRAFEARLPALRDWLAAHVADGETLRGLVELQCFAQAETMNAVRVTVCASAALAGLVDEFDRSIRAQWGGAARDEEAGAALRDYPTDPNDARLIDAGLSPEDRALIAAVNRGEKVAQHLRARWGESDESERLRLNKRLHELRKRHPGLVRPARRKL